jgi:heme exporter protein C
LSEGLLKNECAMRFLRIVYILMPVSILMSFLWAPAAEVHGEAGRLLYFHVPMAWVSTLAFIVSGVFSVMYLRGGGKGMSGADGKAHISAGLGMLFAALATATGSGWSKMMRGAYWNWDVRQTSIIYLMMIYLAYFALRAFLEKNHNRGRIASSYLVFAMATVPFFVFIAPRIMWSLHPETIIGSGNRIDLDPDILTTLIVSLVSYTLLYLYIMGLMNRTAEASAIAGDAEHD